MQTCADYLKEELRQRQQVDSKYSLRAFARFLEMSPSTISQVITGSRRLGVRSAVAIADKCNFPAEKRERFISLAVGAPIGICKIDRVADGDFKLLEMDQFIKVASWQHFAILSLGDLANARYDKSWIASRLNITEEAAEKALEDLLALNMIEVEADKFRQSKHRLRTRTDVSNRFIRQFHSELMGKALTSLSTNSVEERDMTAVTMSVNKRRLHSAKRRIKDFRRSLMKYLAEGKKDEVYALQISLFPLTHIPPTTPRS